MCFLRCSVAKGGEPRKNFTQVSESLRKEGPVLVSPQIWLMLVLLVLPLSHVFTVLETELGTREKIKKIGSDLLPIGTQSYQNGLS